VHYSKKVEPVIHNTF